MVEKIFRNPVFVYGLCGISGVVLIQYFIVAAVIDAPKVFSSVDPFHQTKP
jgi:hypothetical protein